MGKLRGWFSTIKCRIVRRLFHKDMTVSIAIDDELDALGQTGVTLPPGMIVWDLFLDIDEFLWMTGIDRHATIHLLVSGGHKAHDKFVELNTA